MQSICGVNEYAEYGGSVLKAGNPFALRLIDSSARCHESEFALLRLS